MTSREHMRLGGGGNTAWNEKLCERSPGEGSPGGAKLKRAGSFASQILITNYPASWALLCTFKRMEGRKNSSVVEHKTMNQRMGVQNPALPWISIHPNVHGQLSHEASPDPSCNRRAQQLWEEPGSQPGLQGTSPPSRSTRGC